MRAAFAAAFLAVSAAGACAQAQNDPFSSLAKALQQRTDPPEAQDFVRRSRPARELDFVPVNTPRPQPSGKALTREGIRAQEAELEAALARQDRLAGRRTAGAPGRSAAGDPYVAKKKKEPTKCAITCVIK